MLSGARIFTIAVFLISGCLAFGLNPVEASTVNVGVEGEPGGLDGRLNVGSIDRIPINVILEPLLIYDRNFDFQPRLAEEYEFSEDGLEVTFYLREGVTFHNGQPFTAKDVKYTYDWVLDPDNGAPNRDLFLEIEEVEIVDDYTVTFHLTEPFSYIISNIARLNIYPHEYAEEVGEDFNVEPVGTGPFSLEEWERGERIVLKANEDFWGGAPKADYLVFRFIPDDSARLLALEGGEIDLYQGGIIHEEVGRLDDNPNFTVHTWYGAGYDYVGFNTTNEYLQDHRVRKAISHLIDREGIVEYVLNGFGEPGITHIIPVLPWFNENLQPHEYSREKAKELLAEAGYPDGGFKLRIHSRDNDVNQQIAELLQYELETVGIEAEVFVEEWATLFDRAFRSDDHDLLIMGWAGQTDPDRASYRQFHSEGARHPYTYYSNPRMDELLEKGRIVPPESEESRAIYNEVQEIVHEEVPYAVIFYPQEIGLSRDYIQGWELHPSISFSFRNAHKIEIID